MYKQSGGVGRGRLPGGYPVWVFSGDHWYLCSTSSRFVLGVLTTILIVYIFLLQYHKILNKLLNPFVCPTMKLISDNFFIDTDDDILSATLFERESFRYPLGNTCHWSNMLLFQNGSWFLIDCFSVSFFFFNTFERKS